jgi:hypothetical protein
MSIAGTADRAAGAVMQKKAKANFPAGEPDEDDLRLFNTKKASTNKASASELSLGL